MSRAALALGLASVFGSEITLDALDDRVGVADPSGDHLVVLARSPEGYASLSRMLALALLERGEKGAPRLSLDEVASAAREWSACDRNLARRLCSRRWATSALTTSCQACSTVLR